MPFKTTCPQMSFKLINHTQWSVCMMLAAALPPGFVMAHRRSWSSNPGLWQFFRCCSVCRGWRLEGMGERARGCVQWTAIHPELREGFQISPLTFFWAQRSPGTEVAQNWHRPPQRCQGQPLCRGVAGAQRYFVFHSHLTSWFGKGGWGIINQQKSLILYVTTSLFSQLFGSSLEASDMDFHFSFFFFFLF